MMKTEADSIASGGVTSPGGFTAGAVHAGIKYPDPKRLDIGIVFSKVPAVVAAIFTDNKVKAAPVLLDMERVKKGKISAIVMNSGCANACTGERGMADAIEMTELAAKLVGVKPSGVLVSSTGVIGVNMPMECIRTAIPKIKLTAAGGHDFAHAIMTTDRVPKEVAVKAADFSIGGALKGAGMIHPNMATMLCVITTDAVVDSDVLHKALRKAAAISFNMISVDGDGSTNDTVVLLANGISQGEPVTSGSSKEKVFQQALNTVCVYLAKEAVRDGEGATKLIEVGVKGAAGVKDARLAARTIVGSSLVKTAVYGCDPNWGRVLAAAGRSGAALEQGKCDLTMGVFNLLKNGTPVPFDKKAAGKYMQGKEVRFDLNLNIGKGEATAWGCDLTEEYIKINAEYTT
jgi:glutamate N-acetyltransferase / amino-acid N-acetyltransferase